MSYTDGYGTDETVTSAATGKINYGKAITIGSSFDLSDYSSSYNLTLTGTGNYNGFGNSNDNIIIGNSGANTLTGGDGDDTLNGGAGDDTLDAGSGDDKLYGGSGDDILIHSGSGAQHFDGGSGTDTYKKSAVSAGLDLNIEVNLATGYTGLVQDRDHPSQDTVTNIENVVFFSRERLGI